MPADYALDPGGAGIPVPVRGTWRLDWTPASIKLYLDGVPMNSQVLDATINRDPLPAGGLRNPFHGPVYLLLNQVIGGVKGGDPSATGFPVRLPDRLRTGLADGAVIS